MQLIVSDEQRALIDDVAEECANAECEGRSKFPGMTYEQGVAATIKWLIEGEEENPLVD